MKTIQLVAAAAALSTMSAHSASIVVNAVRDYANLVSPNTNAIDTEASGNSQTLTNFTTTVATAFDAGLGGVLDFNSTAATIGNGDTITVNFGSNSVVLTNTNSGPKRSGRIFPARARQFPARRTST